MPPLPALLIVDDDASIRESLELVFEHDFNVSSLPDARGALALAGKTKFAVILVDIVLEGESGIWLLKELRRLRPGTQVIMITADRNLETVVECYSQGAYGYLIKPLYNEEALWLARRAAERQRLEEAKSGGKKINQLVDPISKKLFRSG